MVFKRWITNSSVTFRPQTNTRNIKTKTSQIVRMNEVFLMKFAFLSELLLWNYLEQPIFSKSNGCKNKLKLANQLQIKTER